MNGTGSRQNRMPYCQRASLASPRETIAFNISSKGPQCLNATLPFMIVSSAQLEMSRENTVYILGGETPSFRCPPLPTLRRVGKVALATKISDHTLLITDNLLDILKGNIFPVWSIRICPVCMVCYSGSESPDPCFGWKPTSLTQP